MGQKELERIQRILLGALPLIEKIEKLREGHLLLSLICVNEPIHAIVAYKIDPLMIGAYEHSQRASEQYVSEALESLDENKRAEAIELFTKELQSHGYPITKDLCEEKGLNVGRTNEELEELTCDLHSAYMDALLEPIVDTALIIQTREFAYAMIDGVGMSFPHKPENEVNEGVEKSPIRSPQCPEK